MMHVAVAALFTSVAGAGPAGKAIDVFCDVMSAIPKEHVTGRKQDIEVVMKKFSGMMANKIDCSMDPNNKILGFDLKGASFAECSAAGMKQQQAQAEMIGFATAGRMVCTEKIVDEEANTAAAWMQVDTWVAGYHMRSRIATRLNMDGDKIAGYHWLFDTYQVFALQKLLAQERGVDVDINSGRVDVDTNSGRVDVDTNSGRVDVDINSGRVDVDIRSIALTGTLASSSSAGKAVDAFCNVMSSIPKEQFTGRKEDMQVVMQKFSGMMANKLDCSVDPNNEILGFDLKGASFAECSAAAMKQSQAQAEMIGFSTGGTAFCTEKIVDEEANTAAAWMQFDVQVGSHHMSMRSVTRLNMDGDKIAGYHTIFDTYQIFALQELLAREREEKSLPLVALVSPRASSASAGKTIDAFCDVMSAIPKDQFTGRKEDMEVVMKKFSGMMANKIDCSMDPNNKILGFDLKGVSFAECAAAGMKQSQAQAEMIGFATAGRMVCIEKIADEDANTAAAWMQFDTWVAGHHMRSRIATRLNMDGDKIAGYHMIFDTYQIFALQKLLARERAEKTLPKIALARARASPAGRATDAMCDTFNALGRPQASGGKDMEVTMAKFKGLFADKLDASEDPNNAMLGFNLKGVSFAEFQAAKMKQMQTQTHMLGGMQTKWTMTCFHKIVDADTNNAAVWLNLNQEDPQGNHLFNTRWAMRINMEGDKIAGIHTVYDTFQLVALSEELARGRAVTLSAKASSWAGVGAMAFLGAVALVMAFKKKEQKSYQLLADETSA